MGAQVVAISEVHSCTEDIGTAFWQLWEQNKDYLGRCCIKWIGGNPTDAEDALSRAMLKAWEKVQQYAGKIINFKAWLTRLTYNLCVDIHRERSRGANRVEDIDTISEELGLVSFDETPESAMETGEKKIVISRAIANLPTRLRETFILHFYQELSYPEIAQQQYISYQNVCKRISQARAILRLELRGYFIGEDGTEKLNRFFAYIPQMIGAKLLLTGGISFEKTQKGFEIKMPSVFSKCNLNFSDKRGQSFSLSAEAQKENGLNENEKENYKCILDFPKGVDLDYPFNSLSLELLMPADTYKAITAERRKLNVKIDSLFML